MSEIGAKMDAIKKKLIERDRQKAMEALTEHIHYKIAPEAPPRGGDVRTTEVFGCRADMDRFCDEWGVLPQALAWLLGELRSVNLLENTDIPVTLSRHGTERFCRD